MKPDLGASTWRERGHMGGRQKHAVIGLQSVGSEGIASILKGRIIILGILLERQ